MTYRSLFYVLRLPLVIAFLLVSLAMHAQAQDIVPEDQRLGKEIETIPLSYLQPKASDDQEAPRATTTGELPGTKVVFESYRDGNYEIYIADDNGSNLIRLTRNSNIDIEPRLARGGSKIVFASNRYNNQFDLLSMNLDGTGVTRLTNNIQDDRSPVWSPDGSQILFQTKRDGNWEIYVMNAEGTNQTRLTYNPDDDITPNWSPDGSKIIWSAYRNGGYRIWEMNPDGSGAIQLSQQPYSENPAWSPNGSMIAYDADGNGDGWQEIWVMNADGSNPVNLSLTSSSQSGVDYLVSGWSPTSSWITFTSVAYILDNDTWYITGATLSKTTIAYPSQHYLFSDWVHIDFSPDWQTLDITAPNSYVNPLPSQSPSPFIVSWSGMDIGPSGLKEYDLQVRDGPGGTWETWLDGTYETSHSFSGWSGHTYYFRSRASDRCCNVEAWPEDYDTFTTVETLPPVSTVNPLPALSTTPLVISWTGYDPGGSGINNFSIQYKMDGGNWQSWMNSVGLTSALFTGSSGHTYAFRACASDMAHNDEICPTDGPSEAQTTLASFGLEGSISDNLGNPIAGADVVSSLPAFQNSQSQVDGSYRTLVTTEDDAITLNWEKNGYGSLPATEFSPLPMVGNLNLSLPPADNVIENPGLEYSDSSFLPWSIGGTIPHAISFDSPHTGKTSMRLGAADTFTHVDPIPTSPSSVVSEGLKHAVESDGTIHVTWFSGTYGHYSLYYARRGIDGLWSTPLEIIHDDTLASYGSYNQITVGIDGTVHLLWGRILQNNPVIMYAQRSPSGTWSTPVAISPVTVDSDIEMIIDSRGVASVVWNINNYSPNHSSIFFSQRNSNGTWSEPIQISQVYPSSSTSFTEDSYSQFYIGVNSNDKIFILWHDITHHLVYRYLPLNGSWSDEKIIAADAENLMFGAQIDSSGVIHILTLRNPTQNKLYYLQLNPDGSFTTPTFVTDIQFPKEFKVNIDKNNGLHILWDNQTSPYQVNYIYKPSGGTWSSPQVLSTQNFDIHYLRMALDIYGNPVVAWVVQGGLGESLFKVMYTQKLADNWITAKQFASPQKANFDNAVSISSDERGWINMVWFDRTTGKANISSLIEKTGPQGGASELTQTVTLTPTMTAPVLSYYYQLGNTNLDNTTHLDVLVIQGANTTQLFSSNANTPNWTHRWFDLSPWIGQEITVSFKLYLAAGHPPAWALIDDVSVGSTSPDIWAGAYLAKSAFPGKTVVLNLVYGNCGGPPAQDVRLSATLPDELTFISANSSPTSINGNTLTWGVGNLPGRSRPFTIQVTATLANNVAFFSALNGSIQVETLSPELEIANNTASFQVFVGAKQFLPSISK